MSLDPLLGVLRIFSRNTLPPQGEFLLSVILFAVALALIFAGREIIKILVFLVAGLAGAAVGLALGAQVLGTIGAILGGAFGFIVAGLLGLLLLRLGIGIALGYFGYVVSRDLTHSLFLEVGVSILLFIIGLAFANQLLELLTASLGGIILAGVLLGFGIPPVFSFVLALLAAVVGFFFQNRRSKAGKSRMPPSRQPTSSKKLD